MGFESGSEEIDQVEGEGELDFSHDFGLLVDVSPPVKSNEVDGQVSGTG